jgi:chemotaxis methyl-accepting protein methylase
VDALPPAPPPDDDPDGFAALLAQVERDHGFRVGSYKERCLRRRVAVRMRATGSHTFEQYGRALAADAREYDRLLDALTINVTRLFRNWEAWEALDALVLAGLVGRGGPLRAWSAGCASGEEPYSLAALLHARAEGAASNGGAVGVGAGGRFLVLGTDLDRASLAAAAEGAYADAAFADTPPALRGRYFRPLPGRPAPGAPVARVGPELREFTAFARHDLLRDPAPEGPWQLIACRNVVIYFDRDSQEALFERFHAALAPGGVLFLGKVETLLGRMRTLFAPVDTRQRIFRRL